MSVCPSACLCGYVSSPVQFARVDGVTRSGRRPIAPTLLPVSPILPPAQPSRPSDRPDHQMNLSKATGCMCPSKCMSKCLCSCPNIHRICLALTHPHTHRPPTCPLAHPSSDIKAFRLQYLTTEYVVSIRPPARPPAGPPARPLTTGHVFWYRNYNQHSDR